VSQAEDEALFELLQALKCSGYRFITPTPSTHQRVVARKQEARTIRDVLGWSLPFRAEVIDAGVFALLEQGGVLERQGGAFFLSRIRVSTYGADCFIHSAYPTLAGDAVFFGPDSYRFAKFIHDNLKADRAGLRVVDIGAGAGIGALVATGITKAEAIAADINPLALRYAQINFRAAQAPVSTHQGSGLEGIDDRIDIIIANPPYIADRAQRTYRDGGGLFGGEVTLSWVRQAAERLAVGGRMLVYSASAVIAGRHVLKTPIEEALKGFDLVYAELDPDVFGEELERDDYANVERIAVIGVVARKR
jgi:hypothetical protein